jgi:hypothetical protein
MQGVKPADIAEMGESVALSRRMTKAGQSSARADASFTCRNWPTRANRCADEGNQVQGQTVWPRIS